ncbi:hypothetical protein E2C01_072708 [Portunus trituberculatus]|uniref:Uncharacterized protein n=1 Tax=Portunus trituberculatus TaxID=210409 RepID=A0A5B7I7W6_PORTR|nr:hypothetical protein [Portunus trituberculatus]
MKAMTLSTYLAQRTTTSFQPMRPLLQRRSPAKLDSEVTCFCILGSCIHDHLLVTQPAFLITERASSEFIDRSSGKIETTPYSTHRESEATTPRITSRTFLLLGEHGLHIKAHFARSLFSCETASCDSMFDETWREIIAHIISRKTTITARAAVGQQNKQQKRNHKAWMPLT